MRNFSRIPRWLRRVQQATRGLKSDAAMQRGYIIEGTAACKELDLGNAAAALRRLDARSDHARLILECKKVGMELVE